MLMKWQVWLGVVCRGMDGSVCHGEVGLLGRGLAGKASPVEVSVGMVR